MKKISIFALALICSASVFAQTWTNWPPVVSPVATAYADWVLLNSPDPASFLNNIGAAPQYTNSADYFGVVNGSGIGTNPPPYLVTNGANVSVLVNDAGYLNNAGAFDPAGAAQAVTNGYPWGVLYDAAGAANDATNGLPANIFTLGTASQSNASAFYPASNPSNYVAAGSLNTVATDPNLSSSNGGLTVSNLYGLNYTMIPTNGYQYTNQLPQVMKVSGSGIGDGIYTWSGANVWTNINNTTYPKLQKTGPNIVLFEGTWQCESKTNIIGTTVWTDIGGWVSGGGNLTFNVSAVGVPVLVVSSNGTVLAPNITGTMPDYPTVTMAANPAANSVMALNSSTNRVWTNAPTFSAANLTGLPTTNNLAVTNGTYPNMTVGAATTATSAGSATNSPAGLPVLDTSSKTNLNLYGGVIVLSTNAGNVVLLSNYQAGAECDLVVQVAGIGTNSYKFFSTGNANFPGTLTANGYNTQNGANFNIASTGNGIAGGVGLTNGNISCGALSPSGVFTISSVSSYIGNSAPSIGFQANSTLYFAMDAGSFRPWTTSRPVSLGSPSSPFTNGYFNGYVYVTNGFASYSSNALAPTAISFPATTVNWTNTTAVSVGKNIFLFIDNTGVTGTAVKINGTQIFGSILPIDLTIPLQPGEYFSETYTVGSPTATWKPY